MLMRSHTDAMDKRNFIPIVIICVSILVFLGFRLYAYYAFPTDVVTFDMHVSVGAQRGIKADADALWFGTLPPGNSGSRTIYTNNSNAYSVRIKITAHGDMAKWTSLSNITIGNSTIVATNPFILNPGETAKVDVALSVPLDTKANGTAYEGALKVYIYRAFTLF